jgi:hypothetical protein
MAMDKEGYYDFFEHIDAAMKRVHERLIFNQVFPATFQKLTF